MKTLIILRHAKSSWDDPLCADHDRSLNKRGRRAAVRIGAWLEHKGYAPDEVFCSTATRAAETWLRSGLSAEVRYDRALYHAAPQTYLRKLREATAERVLLIGHNPGIADFAAMMAQSPPDHHRFEDYPTAATTVMAFDIESWADLRPGLGRVEDFVVPRELDDPA